MKKGQGSWVKGHGSSVKIIIFVTSVFVSILTLTPCYSTLIYAETEIVSSAELIENAEALDGSAVTYKGEVVGAILNRGENSWLNVNDGSNAVGIWCGSSQLNSIKFIGGYEIRGDIVEAQGIFRRACPMHGGELDIHADNIAVIESGAILKEHIDRERLWLSIGIFTMGLIVTLIFRKRL
ncbi:MAG: hypothetical protein A2987_01895 [Omnitrophica bacterium RIFCSPLOWO2_01_FULL_45_10]|nr:MAG: hypothetical protein A2987_01895 [Omnitrophica bacterium RIFCSPLOWO2_01_FULL_45_10]